MKQTVVFLSLIFLLFTVVYTQDPGFADIYGKVVLPDGSSIPGVTVTLTGETFGSRSTVTSELGNFRFLRLPPGKYNLKCELTGFKTIIRDGIRIFAGKNITLNIQTDTTTLRQEVVVTGKVGVVDTRKNTVGVNVTEEMIQSLPTARNPWTIMNLIPGMMLSVEDVGGNESGQQSDFYGHGSAGRDSTWNMDGTNVTDYSAVGYAPAYLDMNAYEEVQVTMSSHDITAPTGGVQINFVSKRGGNRYAGDFYLYMEEEDWQLSHDLPESITDKGWDSPGIFRLYQYGFNFGGPIIRDKVWFFASWGIQDIHARTIVQEEDATWLTSAYGKLNFQLGNTSADVRFYRNEKKKWGRTYIGQASQDPGTFWDQSGPTNNLFTTLQHTFGNLMLNVKVNFQWGNFTLEPRGSDINPQTGHNEGADWILYNQPSEYYTGSVDYYSTNRPQINLSFDGNYFMESMLGGDHEIRFGVDYLSTTADSQRKYPNQRILYSWDRNNPEQWKEIWWISDTVSDLSFSKFALYLADTATFGKLTVNLGIRYDRQSGGYNEATGPGLTLHETGEPIFEEWLPELNVPKKTVPGRWEVISPRLSFTYDITGDGKNVVKLSLARYGSQVGTDLAWFLWPLGMREIDVQWNDDGDWIPEQGEWSEDPDDWLWWSRSVNKLNPTSVESKHRYDPNYNSPLLDELALSFEREVIEDLSVAITGFYKKQHHWYRDIGIMRHNVDGTFELETADNWYEYGIAEVGETEVPYYARHEAPVAQYRTNFKNTYNRYLGVQLVVTKKLSKRWMMDLSFTWQDWKLVMDPEEYFDKTNFDYFNKAPRAPIYGRTGGLIGIDSRWMVKLSGLVQLPWDINVTGVFQAREGYIVPYHDWVFRPMGLSWTRLFEGNKTYGEDRLPAFWMLNFGLEKTLKVSDKLRITLLFNAYNITNNDTTLVVNTVIGETQGEILNVLNPAVFQFGIRLNF
jgi:hypothetical protein